MNVFKFLTCFTKATVLLFLIKSLYYNSTGSVRIGDFQTQSFQYASHKNFLQHLFLVIYREAHNANLSRTLSYSRQSRRRPFLGDSGHIYLSTFVVWERGLPFGCLVKSRFEKAVKTWLSWTLTYRNDTIITCFVLATKSKDAKIDLASSIS